MKLAEVKIGRTYNVTGGDYAGSVVRVDQLDSKGCFYCTRQIDGKFPPYIRKSLWKRIKPENLSNETNLS